MSHSTLMVLTTVKPTDEVLATALAPYDENMEVEPYRDYFTDGPRQHWSVRRAVEQGLLSEVGELTWSQVREAYIAQYGEKEVFLIDEEDPGFVRAYTVSTYNPKSRWDWWQVGGRWPNYLLDRFGRRHDQLQRSQLNLEGMRANAGDRFVKRYAGAVEIFERCGHTPWKTVIEQHPDDPGLARNQYWGQQSIEDFKLLLPEDERIWVQTCGDLLDRVLVDQREFDRQVEIERAAAVPCYATLDLEGRWNEPGRMGWFGMSSDSESDRIGYYEAMNGLIQNLDGKVWISVVDVHI